MEYSKKYNLVHITTSGEYKAPLVASQLFDQAECQAINKGNGAPDKVEAWIIGSMREYINLNVQAKITSLILRCPNINIRMINGISRLKSFPIIALMKWHRRKLGKNTPVIYHCRGESAAEWAILLREHFPGDKVVLDVRGYWPAEWLYQIGIESPEKATGDNLAEYNQLKNKLTTVISKVDVLTTVSDALRALLKNELGATQKCAVVPCCVTHITNDDKRAALRKEWHVKDDELLLVYSGTTAAYQHLEDLTIPFMQRLAKSNPKVKLAFFSSQPDKIQQMLVAADADLSKIILKSFPQNEVAGALTACDAGILIRKPTLVNRVANPVKIAEYLAAGLPIIIEKGIGGVSDVMFENRILHGIEITSPNPDFDEEVSKTNAWLNEGSSERRFAVKEYVKSTYLWSAAIHVSRALYKSALEQQ